MVGLELQYISPLSDQSISDIKMLQNGSSILSRSSFTLSHIQLLIIWAQIVDVFPFAHQYISFMYILVEDDYGYTVEWIR